MLKEESIEELNTYRGGARVNSLGFGWVFDKDGVVRDFPEMGKVASALYIHYLTHKRSMNDLLYFTPYKAILKNVRGLWFNKKIAKELIRENGVTLYDILKQQTRTTENDIEIPLFYYWVGLQYAPIKGKGFRWGSSTLGKQRRLLQDHRVLQKFYRMDMLDINEIQTIENVFNSNTHKQLGRILSGEDPKLIYIDQDYVAKCKTEYQLGELIKEIMSEGVEESVLQKYIDANDRILEGRDTEKDWDTITVIMNGGFDPMELHKPSKELIEYIRNINT